MVYAYMMVCVSHCLFAWHALTLTPRLLSVLTLLPSTYMHIISLLIACHTIILDPIKLQNITTIYIYEIKVFDMLPVAQGHMIS